MTRSNTLSAVGIGSVNNDEEVSYKPKPTDVDGSAARRAVDGLKRLSRFDVLLVRLQKVLNLGVKARGKLVDFVRGKLLGFHWRYMVGGMEDYTPDQEQSLLNKQAQDGWELMSVVQKDRVTWFYFRKRYENA